MNAQVLDAAIQECVEGISELQEVIKRLRKLKADYCAKADVKVRKPRAKAAPVITTT